MNDLILKKIGRRRWSVFTPFRFKALGLSTTVPSDFETDLASIPRWAWYIFPPVGDYDRAAVVHDWFYSGASHRGIRLVERKTADKIFRELMLQDGVARWKATVMYWAVRAFGWWSWGRG